MGVGSWKKSRIQDQMETPRVALTPAIKKRLERSSRQSDRLWHFSFCLCSLLFPNFHNSFKQKRNLNKGQRKESTTLIEISPPEHSYCHGRVKQTPAVESLFPVNRTLCSKPRKVQDVEILFYPKLQDMYSFLISIFLTEQMSRYIR